MFVLQEFKYPSYQYPSRVKKMMLYKRIAEVERITGMRMKVRLVFKKSKLVEDLYILFLTHFPF